MSVFFIHISKLRIFPRSTEKKGSIKTGHLYTQIVGDTLNLYLPIPETEFRVFRDQRILKGVVLKDFNEQLITQLLPQLPAKTIIQIQAMDSTSSAQIQVADWICGALARYHEDKPQGKEFYNILKNNIIKDQELFSDYWTKNWGK